MPLSAVPEFSIFKLQARLQEVVRLTLKWLVQLYRWSVSPMLGPRCRYWPSCSEYCLEALELHGTRLGLWLAIKRLARCQPWGSSGYDPVPGCAQCGPHGFATRSKKSRWPAQLRRSADTDQ